MSSERLQHTRPIYKNQLHFYILVLSNPQMKLRKVTSFIIVSKQNKIFRNKLNKSSTRLVQ